MRLGLVEMPAEQLAAPALVLAPHPDDETLGCGGTIVKKRRAGARVQVAFLTDGRAPHARFLGEGRIAELRRSEAMDACAALGLHTDDLVFLDYEDGALAEHAAAVEADVAALIRELRPTQVFAPCPWDVWPDHLTTAAVAAAAIARTGGVATLLGYAIWFWDRWPWTPSSPYGPLPLPRKLARAVVGHWRLWRRFTLGVALGDALEDKRAAFARHRSQIARLVDDPDWPVLGEVAGGRLLPMLLGELEVFAPAGPHDPPLA